VAREKRLARKPGYERLEREPDLDRPRGRPARSALLIERDVRIDLTSVRCQVYPDGMDYTHGMLARLAHADAACELSERLGAQADPSSDSYGQGAFLTEEAQSIYSEARSLLAAAVVADRVRGASWADVGEALGITRQSAHERFEEAEREFREALLFPHRYPEEGGLGYTVAPYAEEPDRVRERLDRWVVERRRSTDPSRDKLAPVTQGLGAMRDSWTIDRMGEVLQLSQALIDRKLPTGVSYERARRRQAELKVELYERMAADHSEDSDVALQLMRAREDLTLLDTREEPAQ
jgi:hypothetical protein